MLKGEMPDEFDAHVLDVALILQADHELNASTFTARVVAGTLADMYSAVTAALGALSGPLHGGANTAVMKMLLEKGVYPAIATHDEAAIEQTKAYAAAHQIARDRFEFQMLYGIRRDLQRRLVDEGYRLRLYVPFGEAWYPYYMRRLAERPANVVFMLRNLFRR